MSVLAINGGKPTRDVKQSPWPVWPRFDDADRTRLNRVLESGVWSYGGPMETEALRLWSDFQGGSFSSAVANGTVALQLALEALDIGFGDEVIIPGLTWQATAAAVIDVNAVPIMVDVDPMTWCIDPSCVRAAMTSKTKAIIAVHLYGAMADMDELAAIADEYDVAIIEDSAHQHGSEWRGRKAGTIGAIGAFSLQLSKPLTTGEGGLLNTSEYSLWQRLDALRNCGRRPVESNTDISKGSGVYSTEGDFVQSGNYRITDFQAALLIGGIGRLVAECPRRENNARLLDDRLSSMPGVIPVKPYAGQTVRSFFNYAIAIDPEQFTDRTLASDRIRAAIAAELGVPVASCYEPLNDCSLYRPHTKRRYNISSEHWSAIDPKRFSLPVCKSLFRDRAITFHHAVLLDNPETVGCIADAVEKVQSFAHEL